MRLRRESGFGEPDGNDSRGKRNTHLYLPKLLCIYTDISSQGRPSYCKGQGPSVPIELTDDSDMPRSDVSASDSKQGFRLKAPTFGDGAAMWWG